MPEETNEQNYSSRFSPNPAGRAIVAKHGTEAEIKAVSDKICDAVKGVGNALRIKSQELQGAEKQKLLDAAYDSSVTICMPLSAISHFNKSSLLAPKLEGKIKGLAQNTVVLEYIERKSTVLAQLNQAIEVANKTDGFWNWLAARNKAQAIRQQD